MASRKVSRPKRRGAKLAQNSEGSASSRRRGRGRGHGRPFQPGQSGNPGGRPKLLKELKERIQRRGEDLVDYLLGIADQQPKLKLKGGAVVGPNHRERILAIKELMAYGYGRPVLAVEVSGPGGGPLEHRDITLMSSAERHQRMDELLTKASTGAAAASAVDVADDDGAEDDEDDSTED